MRLIGREQERSRVSAALLTAEGGQAARVLLIGAPGTGKTALLHDGVDAATGFAVLRARGAESERSLSYGSLVGMLRGHHDRLERLPEFLRSALTGALALSPPMGADRLAVGVGLLHVLADIASERPTLIAVDDLQWVDEASRDALLFACRRLHADRLAAVATARPDPALAVEGFEVVHVEGLGAPAAVELLVGRFPLITEPVAAGLAQRCDGNPLAMLEIAARLSAAQLQGLAPLGSELPIGAATIELFRRPIESLTHEERFTLLVAALCETSDQRRIEAACVGALGRTGDWSSAERARLVRVDVGSITFAHPLVRDSVVACADAPDLRHAHAALGDTAVAAEQRAWHLASAATGPDDALAADLVGVAVATAGRGDPAAALRAARRAAVLSSTPAQAAPIHLLAAQLASATGADHRPHVAAAIQHGAPAVGAEALVVAAAVAAWQSDVPALRALYDGPLAELETSDPMRAAIIHGFGTLLAWHELDLEELGSKSARAWQLADERLDLAHPFGVMPAIARGFDFDTPNEHIERTADYVRMHELADLATPLVYMLTARRRALAGLRFAETMFGVASARGAVAAAAWTAVAASTVAYQLGDILGSRRWATRGLDLAESAGPLAVAMGQAQLALVAAVQGDTASCRMHVTTAHSITDRVRNAPSHDIAAYAEVLSMLLDGDTAQGVEALEAWPRAELDLALTGFFPVLVELPEAYVRLGRSAEARALRDRLETLERHPRLGDRGAALRSLGLISDDGTPHFEQSIEVLQAEGRQVELARTRLCFGERLRRDGRRSAARAQLTAALATFDAQCCAPWAARTRKELRALGAPASDAEPRRADGASALTAQEEQVAHAVARGLTNREVAVSLFMSAKTVESHLTRVYRKLGVRSRTELANLLLRG